MDSDDSDSDIEVNTSWDWQSENALRHVTVRQLLEATQIHSTAPFEIESKEIRRIIIVANLCFMNDYDTHIDIGIDDGTGRIKGRQWKYGTVGAFEPQEDFLQASDFPYVRVMGELASFKGKNTIKVITMQLVSNQYEPYYHILHAIRDTLFYERGPPPSHDGQTVVQNTATTGDVNNSYTHKASQPFATSPMKNNVASLTSHERYTTPSPASNEVQQDYRAGSSPSPGPWSRSQNFKEDLDEIIDEDSHSQQDSATPTQFRPHSQQFRNRQEIPRSSRRQPVLFPSSQQQHSPTRRDPYSNLTPLERDIILCIQTAAAQHSVQSPTMYPSPGASSKNNHTAWEGVNITVITSAMKRQRPGLTINELHDAFEHLLEESYIFNPIDDGYFDCV